MKNMGSPLMLYANASNQVKQPDVPWVFAHGRKFQIFMLYFSSLESDRLSLQGQ